MYLCYCCLPKDHTVQYDKLFFLMFSTNGLTMPYHYCTLKTTAALNYMISSSLPCICLTPFSSTEPRPVQECLEYQTSQIATKAAMSNGVTWYQS